ncbi:hypothetical protein C8R47DRAFT_1219242 [Mycena vitilis]|nr:hypothetical protein C8R47DRAFT_1330149 [Mycena vitilis]KAJ6479317.1 hypothetical protein C8R47DRAFT_1219242 [Mycena vitilis]
MGICDHSACFIALAAGPASHTVVLNIFFFRSPTPRLFPADSAPCSHAASWTSTTTNVVPPRSTKLPSGFYSQLYPAIHLRPRRLCFGFESGSAVTNRLAIAKLPPHKISIPFNRVNATWPLLTSVLRIGFESRLICSAFNHADRYLDYLREVSTSFELKAYLDSTPIFVAKCLTRVDMARGGALQARRLFNNALVGKPSVLMLTHVLLTLTLFQFKAYLDFTRPIFVAKCLTRVDLPRSGALQARRLFNTLSYRLSFVQSTSFGVQHKPQGLVDSVKILSVHSPLGLKGGIPGHLGSKPFTPDEGRCIVDQSLIHKVHYSERLTMALERLLNAEIIVKLDQTVKVKAIGLGYPFTL